jgi:Alpha/beta hydrolase domain
MEPKRIIAMGESQSAFFMTTYVNAIDPLARVYDGYLIHSRSGAAAPIDGASMLSAPEALKLPVKLRTDMRVPVMQVHTETDVAGLLGSVGFYAARQPDSSNIRTWEIAGAAHADNYLFRVGGIDSGLTPVEQLATAWAPMSEMSGMKLTEPLNNGPQHHYIAQAALHHLTNWLRNGKVPAKSEALQLSAIEPLLFATDTNGNVHGGVRSPWVDVPTSKLSGLNNSPGPTLVGSVKLFDQATLDRLYPGGRDEYMSKFTVSLDSAVSKGVILAADREEILAIARISYHGK